MRLRLAAVATLPLLVGALTACGDDDSDKLIIYSGRSEELVGGLLDQLEEQVDVEVEVRYADSAEMAAQLLEEGDATEADLFFSQDAGALGALAQEGMLSELDPSVLSKVDGGHRAIERGGPKDLLLRAIEMQEGRSDDRPPAPDAISYLAAVRDRIARSITA